MKAGRTRRNGAGSSQRTLGFQIFPLNQGIDTDNFQNGNFLDLVFPGLTAGLNHIF